MQATCLHLNEDMADLPDLIRAEIKGLHEMLPSENKKKSAVRWVENLLSSLPPWRNANKYVSLPLVAVRTSKPTRHIQERPNRDYSHERFDTSKNPQPSKDPNIFHRQSLTQSIIAIERNSSPTW